MRNLGGGLLAAALISLALGLANRVSPAQSDPGAGGRKPQPSRAEDQREELGSRASDLMGKKVYCIRGEKLGRVSDLVIDTYTGGLTYVLISSGGVAGIGAHRRAVPPGALSLATVRRDAVSLNVTPEHWRAVPTLDRELMAKLGDPAQAGRIYQYFPQARRPAAGQEATLGTSRPAGERDRTGVHGAPTGSLRFASDLIGKRVENQQGRVAGRIVDLLVELKKPKRALAIFEPAGFLIKREKLSPDHLFLVGVNDLKASGGRGRIALEVAPAGFRKAQTLEADNWMRPGAATDGPIVYQYPRNPVDADNTGRNVRDRQPGAITPSQQSESREDLQLTCDIRQSLVKDRRLSLRAKNVKVISAGGRVVLRGPVRSEEERSEIGRLAEQAAGVWNVENNLEIARK
jgi:hyperosmotically inducible protein